MVPVDPFPIFSPFMSCHKHSNVTPFSHDLPISTFPISTFPPPLPIPAFNSVNFPKIPLIPSKKSPQSVQTSQIPEKTFTPPRAERHPKPNH